MGELNLAQWPTVCPARRAAKPSPNSTSDRRIFSIIWPTECRCCFTAESRFPAYDPSRFFHFKWCGGEKGQNGSVENLDV